MGEPRHCYSLNEEEWEGPFDSEEQAIAEALGDLESGGDLEEGTEYYTGVCEDLPHGYRVRGDWICESLTEHVNEALLIDTDWPKVSEEATEELTEQLTAALESWLTKHAPGNFWEPSKIKKHQVTDSDVEAEVPRG